MNIIDTLLRIVLAICGIAVAPIIVSDLKELWVLFTDRGLYE